MKNFKKKILAAVLTAGVVSSMAVTTAFADNGGVTKTPSGIKNEYLEIKRDNDGDFTIHAIVNPETGETTKLLFDMTSDIVLSIDGVYDEFSTYSIDDGVVEGDSIKDTDASNSKIECERSLKFIPNKVNGKKNVVEVKFTAKNISNESHMVGGRIMLDTMLDTNDDAPFRVAGVGEVTNRIQFNGNEIPSMYQAFDSLENPSIVSTGYFASGSYRPDYVQFNNYWISDSNYNPVCDTSLSLGDSVVNSIWNPVELKPGESKTYITYYGLGELDVIGGSLTLGATRSAGSFEINEEGTGYNPVSITAYLKNTSAVDIANAQVALELPDGVSVQNGENTAEYPNLAPAVQEQKTWVINAEPSDTEKTVTVKIAAKADDIDAIDPIEYSFIIPAIEGATQPTTEEPTTVPTQPTTVADTTVPTVPTVQPTTSPATPENPESPATVDEPGNIATGDSRVSIALLATLLCAAGIAAVISRKREEK